MPKCSRCWISNKSFGCFNFKCATFEFLSFFVSFILVHRNAIGGLFEISSNPGFRKSLAFKWHSNETSSGRGNDKDELFLSKWSLQRNKAFVKNFGPCEQGEKELLLRAWLERIKQRTNDKAVLCLLEGAFALGICVCFLSDKFTYTIISVQTFTVWTNWDKPRHSLWLFFLFTIPCISCGRDFIPTSLVYWGDSFTFPVLR